MIALPGRASAQAREYYVSSSGSDSNSGSQASPWKTIQHAIESFTLGTSGTIIHVAAGTYGGASSCLGNNAVICVDRGGSSKSVRLTLQCDADWSVPSGSGCLIRNSAQQTGIGIVVNNVDVAGFDYGNDANATQGIVVVCNPANNGPCATGNSVHILNNYVHDIAQSGNDGGPGGSGCPSSGAILVNQHHGSSVTDAQVIANRTSNYGNQALAIRNGGSCNFAHGIYVDTPGALVQNNVVLDSVAYGIHYYSAPCNAVITNNTVLRSGASNIILAGGDICSSPGNSTITNNITYISGRYGIQLGTGGGTAPCSSASPILVSNNLTNGNPSGGYGQTNSCSTPLNQLSEAPTTTFVNYLGNGNDDVHLKSGSLAIERGTTSCVGSLTNCVPTTDFAGLVRAVPPSLGIYEFATSSSTPLAPTGLVAIVQ